MMLHSGWIRITIVMVFVVTIFAAPSSSALAQNPATGKVVAWGTNNFGQNDVPAGLSGVIAIDAGEYHSLALKNDGTVVAWGWNGEGETDIPAGLSGVIAIDAGGCHNLALKNDGTVVAWGWNSYGETDVPAGLDGVIAIAAGYYHSLALKNDGTVVAWGRSDYGETSVPVELSGVIAIAAGVVHSLALKNDGTVIGWGDNAYGETDAPAGLSGVIAIAAGGHHSLALKNDGTVAAWGDNKFGENNVPAGLSGVIAIAAGNHHNLALKNDGTVVAWNGYDVPIGLNGISAIAAGYSHSLALGNPTPVAQDQSVTTDQDTPIDISLAATNFFNDALTYTIVSPPDNGTLAGEAPNLTYTPNTGYFGSDRFTFKANDGTADSHTVTVSITVVHVNQAPLAQSQAIITKRNTPLNISLVATDNEGDPLAYAILANPSHGKLSGSAPELTYTPGPGYVGSDAFSFKANDGRLDSNVATIAITVKAGLQPALILTMRANPTTYSYPGQIITYRYEARNTGDVALSGPFMVTDNKLGAFQCSEVTNLPVNASISCGKVYTILPSDLNSRNNATITNHATVAGKFGSIPVRSSRVQTSVNQVAPSALLLKSTATCLEFKADTATQLTNEYYTVKSGRINSITPGLFTYYSAVMAPESNFQVTIQESNLANWSSIGVYNQNAYVFNSDCFGIDFEVSIDPDKVVYTISNASSGSSYTFATTYQANTLMGQPVLKPFPTIPYLFTTLLNNNEIMTSWDSINVKPK